MLLLKRKKGEIITIGKLVQVEIVDFQRGTVTLGINAPENIPVHRKEIYDAIIKQNQQAVKTNIIEHRKILSNVILKEKKTNN